MRQLLRRLAQPVLWRWYRWYNSRQHWYRGHGLRVCLYPSVFHPSLMLTTQTFLNYIKTLPIQNKNVLELGAGNGLVALWCAQAGAQVTASDINPAAIRSIQASAQENALELSILESDLFQKIPPQRFDYIFINPPYFPQAPTNHQEMAFFCGPEFEYFHQLFNQLPAFVQTEGQVLFILTDDCDLDRIKAIAQQNNQALRLAQQSQKWGEQHLIYNWHIKSENIL